MAEAQGGGAEGAERRGGGAEAQECGGADFGGECAAVAEAAGRVQGGGLQRDRWVEPKGVWFENPTFKPNRVQPPFKTKGGLVKRGL